MSGVWLETAWADNHPPAGLIQSPYDPEARYTTKRDTPWVGYNVHLAEDRRLLSTIRGAGGRVEPCLARYAAL
jgi:hypothetical protein